MARRRFGVAANGQQVIIILTELTPAEAEEYSRQWLETGCRRTKADYAPSEAGDTCRDCGQPVHTHPGRKYCGE